MTDEYYGPNWGDVRDETLAEYGDECLLCTADENLEVHHIEPFQNFESHEQANRDENLVPLCGRCHRRVESIQNPHNRRTVEHFVEELEAEGLPDLTAVLKEVAHKPLRTNNLTACPAEGCFYPTKSSDPSCPGCDHPLGGGRLHGPEMGVWCCTDCGETSLGSEWEPPDPFNCWAGGTHDTEFIPDSGGGGAVLLHPDTGDVRRVEGEVPAGFGVEYFDEETGEVHTKDMVDIRGERWIVVDDGVDMVTIDGEIEE